MDIAAIVLSKSLLLYCCKKFTALLFTCFSIKPWHLLYFFPLPQGQKAFRLGGIHRCLNSRAFFLNKDILIKAWKFPNINNNKGVAPFLRNNTQVETFVRGGNLPKSRRSRENGSRKIHLRAQGPKRFTNIMPTFIMIVLYKESTGQFLE